jgi:serine kinase of HPr protein (carbohydrate metabolism regulator)
MTNRSPLIDGTNVIPKKITSTETNVIVLLGVGVLIFIVDKRESHYLDEIIQAEHKMTQIHKMLTEEIRFMVCHNLVPNLMSK